LVIGVRSERRAQHDRGIVGGLDHDPDVPGKHEFPSDALLQILAAKICGL
jgi:hypothetical protein